MTWFAWECTSRFYTRTAECLGAFVSVLTRDSVKVGDHVLPEERDHGRFLDLWPLEDRGEDDVQPLPGLWELTPEEARIANDRAMSIFVYR